MAANIFKGGSGNAELDFDRAIDYINLNVASGVTFALSVDGVDYISIPAGFHSFEIGQTKKLYVQSTGAWQLLAAQA